MRDKNTAMKMVIENLNADFSIEHDDELVIVPEDTIEKEYGWHFFYNSKKYLETGEFSFRVVGNGPVIFDKRDGSIHRFGAYKNPLQLIKEYEERRSKG